MECRLLSLLLLPSFSKKFLFVSVCFVSYFHFSVINFCIYFHPTKSISVTSFHLFLPYFKVLGLSIGKVTLPESQYFSSPYLFFLPSCLNFCFFSFLLKFFNNFWFFVFEQRSEITLSN